jgi:hypothetical protein
VAAVLLAGCDHGKTLPSAATATPRPTTRADFLAVPYVGPVPAATQHVVAADLDGDGQAEAIVSGANGATPAVLRFGREWSIRSARLPGRATDLTLTLLDTNESRDLIALDPKGGALTLFRGQGDTTFASPSRHLTRGTPKAFALADADADGYRDLVVLNEDGGVVLLRGHDGGRFTYPQRAGTFPNAVGLTALDVNGDRAADLVLSDGQSLQLAMNDGHGGFGPPQTIGATSFPPLLRTADVNRDGRPDLLSAGPDGVDVRLVESGGLAGARTYRLPNGGGVVSGIAAGDLDDDGYPDLVIGQGGYNSVRIALGDGSGAFRTVATHKIGTTAAEVAIGDIDGDCAPDVLVGTAERTLAFLHNTLTASCADRPPFLPGKPGPFPAPPTAPPAILPGGRTLSGPVRSDVGGDYTRPLFADLDGNGLTDITVVHATEHRITVWLGKASGRFDRPRQVPVPDLSHPVTPPCHDTFMKGRSVPTACAGRVDRPSGLAVGDIDGDGRLDLVTGTGYGRSVAVLRGDGHGNFAPQQRFLVRGNVWDVTVADVTGDGAPDVLAQTDRVEVLRNDAHGHLAPGQRIKGVGHPVVGDVDGDGDLDLIVTTLLPTTLVTYLNDGSGHFSAVRASNPVPNPDGLSGQVLLAEVTGDHHPDLIVTASQDHQVLVAAGDGTGGFAAPQKFDTGGSLPVALAVGDVSADRHPDLVVACQGSNEVAVLVGDGYGGFAAPALFPTGGQGPYGVHVTDVNGDHTDDVLVWHIATKDVAVRFSERA